MPCSMIASRYIYTVPDAESTICYVFHVSDYTRPRIPTPGLYERLLQKKGRHSYYCTRPSALYA